MRLTLYPDKAFAVYDGDNYQITLKLNPSGSLIYTYAADEQSLMSTYESADDLERDSALLPVVIWMARGLAGIPAEIKNKAS